MRNLLLQGLCFLLLLLSKTNASHEYDTNSILDAYADSYCQVVNSKFLMIELETYVNPQNAEETTKLEILRLEHLYQSKWAKEFLESIGAKDKKLMNLYNDEYRKALEDDTAFQHNIFAHRSLYNRMKRYISNKWENRKKLDIAEGKFFTETSDNLRKYRAKLKALESAAVIASNAYRKTSTYLRGVGMGISTNDTLNEAEITEAYEKARSEFSDGTEELGDKIKLLEMKRFQFLKSDCNYSLWDILGYRCTDSVISHWTRYKALQQCDSQDSSTKLVSPYYLGGNCLFVHVHICDVY
uniref:Uncharacterized protein n=1 Tax=Trichobilharzia regenti TaxID=157069 RepID=A0AA85IS22_TRIRE|nr:unnamed protein product [Trichobilharzia regenti]